jgi:hypothetical protein
LVKARIPALAVALLVMAPASAQELVGTWKGAGDGASLDRGLWQGNGGSIVVTEQSGRAFKAQVVWQTPEGEGREDILGVIAPDGKTLHRVGNDGHHMATLQSATVMDHCYVETGDDALAVCSRLERQP